MRVERRHHTDPVLDFATTSHPACGGSMATGGMTARASEVDCPLCRAWIEGNLDEAFRIRKFVDAQGALIRAMTEVSKAHTALEEEMFMNTDHDSWYENRKLVCDFFRKYMEGGVVLLQREPGVKRHGTP